MPQCLVTGASGFIGRALCSQLLADGAEVVALVRRAEALPLGCKLLLADLHEDVPGPEQLQGVEVIFHLAGIAHQRGSAEEYRRINYQATLELARAAAAAGVQSFIFVSSVKAMGEAPGEQPRSEDDLVEPADDYGRSKRDAELTLQKEFTDSAMSVVILRPALVYGDGVRGNLGALESAAQRGLPAPPEQGARSMVGRDDLVELLVGFYRQPPSGLSSYIACDGERYSSRRIYRTLLVARGAPPPRLYTPLWLWRILCALLDASGRLDSGNSYRRLFSTELYDASRARRERHWQPQLTLEKSLGLPAGASR